MNEIFILRDSFEEHIKISSFLLYGAVEKITSPCVSVIMPVYNRPDYFKKSLKSVLEQDFDSCYEIVVVDNYDRDGESPNLHVVKEAEASNVLYYRNEQNLGMYGNWNRGIKLSRAEYITFCHDDDILLPHCLSRLMTLQKKTGKKCILSRWNEIDENDNYISKYDYPYTKFWLFKERDHCEYTLYHQFLGSMGFGIGCLFNRQYMLELGGYNKEYYPSADYALQTAYTYYYGCVLNNVPTFNYRIASNESSTVFEQFAERDLFFRKCMIPKIHQPKWWLRRVMMANYRISKRFFAIIWGGKDVSNSCEVGITDRIIMRLCLLFNNMKRYRLNVPV